MRASRSCAGSASSRGRSAATSRSCAATCSSRARSSGARSRARSRRSRAFRFPSICCPAITTRSTRRRCTARPRSATPHPRTSTCSTTRGRARWRRAWSWSARRGSSRRPARNPALDALESLGPAGPLRILAAHGGVDALTPDRRDASLLPLAPIERRSREDRIHYAALGDRHSLTRVGASGRIWYAGTPEPTDFDEREPGFALVVELDRDGVRAEPHHVGTWRFARPEPASLDGTDDLDALADRLADFDAKERTALRLELRGSLDLRGAARLDALLDRARDLFAGLDVRDASCASPRATAISKASRSRASPRARWRGSPRKRAAMRPTRPPRATRSRCWSGSRMRRRPRREGPAPAPAQLPRHRGARDRVRAGAV